MRCAEFEPWLLEHAEGSLPEEKRPLLIAHLAECAQCRQTLADLQSLDHTLSREIRKPQLSADFNERLWQRIRVETGGAAPTQLPLERVSKVRAEYEAGLRALRRGKILAAGLIDALGLGLLVGGFAYALYKHLPEFLKYNLGLREWGGLDIPVLAAGCAIAFAIGVLIRDWLKPAGQRSLF
jgi:anti-sigma factor RsiW